MKTKIKNVLQLDKKWIKVMLTISVLLILTLSMFPDNFSMKSMRKSEQSQEIMVVTEIPLSREDSVLYMIQNHERNIQKLSQVSRDTQNLPMEVTEDLVSSSAEPIVIQIVSDPQPFDWKTMISWIVGSMNGVVLLVMNLKNIKKK